MAVFENIFLCNGLAYSSHQKTLPPFIFQTQTSSYSPSDARRLCLGLNAYPHIAFVPVSVRFRGPLFNRLNDRTLHSHDAKWELHADLRESWCRLENGLWNVAIILQEALSNHMWSLNFSRFPPPSHFGYLRSHKSQNIAKRCINSSVDAFVTLTSFCSYLIALHCDAEGHTSANASRWTRILHANGVHPAWVENFAKSDFNDFTNTERIGTIVHPGCGWLEEVPMMLRFNIPIWVLWREDAPDDYRSKPGGLKICAFFPSHDNIVEKRRQAEVSEEPQQAEVLGTQQTTLSIQPASPAPRTSPILPTSLLRSTPPPNVSAAVPRMFPRSENGSLQRYGEGFKEFFDRMNESYERAKATETEALRAQRVSRERSATTGGPPGRSGPRVYVWEEDIDFEGYLLRKLVPRSQVPDVWDQYSFQQRRFDGRLNQWDLCFELGPDKEENGYEDDEDLRFLSGSWGGNWDGEVCDWKKDLVYGYCAYQTPGLDVDLASPSLEDILYRRYGFHVSPDYVSSSPNVSTSLQDIKTVLGHRNAFAAVQELAAIVEFYHALLEDRPIPPSICDLYDSNEIPLKHHLQSLNSAVKVCSVKKSTYYFLETTAPGFDTTRYSIAVTDPMTAVQHYRERWGTTRQQLAKSLLDLGIPFNTYTPLSTPDTSPARRFRPLGEKPDRIPDSFDYAEYEDRLLAFLHQPRGRAALLRGGIVWRLAKEVLGNTLNEMVLAGPSTQAYQYGHSLTFDAAQGQFWDDVLLVEELHLVCGLYLQYSGKSFNKRLLHTTNSFSPQVPMENRLNKCPGGPKLRLGKTAL